MTLRHMKIFLCVCDENNMTRAAALLHMTQPSVSLAIQELEEHYGVRLFERLGRRLFITDAGRRLQTYTRHIVSLNQQAEEAMRAVSGLYRLRIGASVTIGESILVELLQYMYETNPKQEIFSEIHNTAELEAMLLKDELDLALVEGEIQSDYLIEEAFMKDELIFIAAPHSRLLEQNQISKEDLSQIPFFVREAGSGTRNLFEQVMQANKLKFQVAGVYNNAESIKKAVGAGLGFSAISWRAVRGEVLRGELMRFDVDDIEFKRNFSLVYHKNKYIPPELQTVIELCRKIEGIL
jgi:LysR family transcriptional regulator, transcriptional activator of the cysJI operon